MGNIVQACTVKYVTDMWNQVMIGLEFQCQQNTAETQVYLINCMAASSSPDKAGPECFSQLGLDYSAVETCAGGEEGQRLHFHNGEEQNGLSPE